MEPGNIVEYPISAISFGMVLMFGTAGLPHILLRFFTLPSARGAEVGDSGQRLNRLLLPADLHHRLRRHHLRAHQPAVAFATILAVAVALGILFKKQNTSFMVSLAFAIAARAARQRRQMGLIKGSALLAGATVGSKRYSIWPPVALTIL